MSILIQVIKWLVVATLVFAGVDLLLTGFGFDMAQMARGSLGADLILRASALVQSLAKHLVPPAYTLAGAAVLLGLALLVAFVRR